MLSLNSFTNVQCTETGSKGRTEFPYSAPRPAECAELNICRFIEGNFEELIKYNEK